MKDSKGKTISSKYYKVTIPTGRKAIGKYTYKITFKGRYGGTKNLTYTITPKATTISKVTGAKKTVSVKWKKAAKGTDNRL